MQGELFTGKCLGGNCPGRNFIGEISWWGNCLVGACPDGNYLKVIVQPAKVRRIIILKGSFIGVIVLGDCFTWVIIKW